MKRLPLAAAMSVVLSTSAWSQPPLPNPGDGGVSFDAKLCKTVKSAMDIHNLLVANAPYEGKEHFYDVFEEIVHTNELPCVLFGKGRPVAITWLEIVHYFTNDEGFPMAIWRIQANDQTGFVFMPAPGDDT